MNILNVLKPYADVLENESLTKHATFRIGGVCDYFIYPESILCLMRILRLLQERHIPYAIFGKGGNLLCSDEPYHGAVICLDRYLNNFYFEEDGTLIAEAGCSIILLAQEAMRRSLSGLEFASGIPGTLGGAMYMNAGAYGGELKQVVESVTILTMGGEEKTLSGEECAFGYRTSVYQKLPCVIVKAVLQLHPGDPEKIGQTMRTLMEKRRASQPLELPSAGSTFKRPTGYFAGPLIEQAGLKGCGVGGAEVSKKHAGFVVNTGGASADDVEKTIAMVQSRVWEASGVQLEPEVRIW